MHKLERIGLWAVLVATAVVTTMNYGAFRQLQETVAANSANLNQPGVAPSVVPGIPADLRGAWENARNNAQGAAFTDQLWLTVRLTNEDAGRASEVFADLSFVDPIEDLFVYTAAGETFESMPYGRPFLAEGGAGETAATVEFGPLPAGESHLIFVGLRPRDYGAAPYDVADYLRWSDDFGRHWNAVRVTAAAVAASPRRTTVVEYGSGSSGLSATTTKPVLERDSG